MKIFLDTNIVMDYLTSRGDTESVNRIFQQIESGIHVAYISIGSFYTITYLMERFLKAKEISDPERTDRLREIMESILAYINIAGHTKEQLLRGIKNAEFQDLEDSYQYEAALSARCDCLITNNIKDFRNLADPLIDIIISIDFVEE